MSSQRWICVATTVALLAAGNAANAQCEWNWADGFQLGGHGLDGPAYALLTFDDGSGPALYTGGAFRSAGEVDADRVARWDGQDWSALGGGLGDEVWALAAFDDGRGLALYAGGKFKAADGQSAYRVAKWNGEAWSPVGGGIEHGLVHTLAVFDDGTGPALYAGVSYFAASPTSATGVMKWDGTTWSQVGGGLNGAARALAVFDDGRGPALYAGGWFVTASGTAVNHVAKWDGVAWSPLGAGLDQAVDALAVFDDGRGPALYAAGKFTAAGATTVNGIARWDGARWSALAGGVRGIDARVYALTGYDDSGGPALYAAGTFATAGGAAANNIARWDGTSWWPLGTGVDSAVHALAVFDNGSGPVLCAVGAFSTAGGADARYAASWDGAAWAPMVSPRGNGVGSEVRALAIYDDGSGAALYVGGAFTLAGSIRANRVAKWGGSTWSPLGSGVSGGSSIRVNALTMFDAGGGPALYVGGRFTTAGDVTVNNIARWDGAAWSALSTGVSSDVYALAVCDVGTGPALYAGGSFTTASGVTVNRVARWDGTSWTALGAGFNGTVRALAEYDNGDGPGIFAGGEFTRAGGLYVNYIARWNGTAWNQLQREFDGAVRVLRVFDDGLQTALYAGGAFENSDFFVLNRIGRYVGRSDNYYWRPLGDGVEVDYLTEVRALTPFDAGSGPVLAVGGCFTTAGGGEAYNIALWDGTSWSPLGSGVGSCVNALAAWDEESGPALWAGGYFSTAGGKLSDCIAKWACLPDDFRAARAPGTAGRVAEPPVTSRRAQRSLARSDQAGADPVPSERRAGDRGPALPPYVAGGMDGRMDTCAGAIWSTTDDLGDWDWALGSQDAIEHSASDDFWFEGEPGGYTFVGAVHWQAHYWNDQYAEPETWAMWISEDPVDVAGERSRYYSFRHSDIVAVPVGDGSIQCQAVLPRSFRADNNVWCRISIEVDAEHPPIWGIVCHVADPPLGLPACWKGPDWDSDWTPNYDPAGHAVDMNFCLLPGTPWVCEVLGDVNGDGMDNTFDITPFVFALTHTQAELEHAHPSWLYWCADCNEDGRVDNFDVGPFIYELTH